ncbi:EamA family transporter [Anabaena aphanizomenioides LEGE 00250]|uniref:EamA family transporter n=1 Tax=Sphaerospermopsis aphanizomenoides LEGE 00250 TaxID=2777972 RepID=A0ABR9VC79_9CYAN|nr:EamA family transporter [Sphaerospermopsis aphanizomenoides]MBE9236106.1 EamA family transporter [Sphaerospermopsis aphanizomenoides LEGE 00250]
MGRFEKRPENSRNRSDLSRAAENALWDVVEDLEQLQQNVIRTLQDDVKRLETEKNRLANDIQRLIEEKEKLQQARQITEQQVLIRQLAEVLAKHISSQLQSSLKSLADQSITGESSHQSTFRSAEVNSTVASQISENVSQMLNNLDDTVTIAFSSIQKELTNYQSHLSQQLLRMYDQQQQGEEILAEFVKRLREELENIKDANSLKILTGGAPTVLQLGETYKNGFSENSSERIVAERVSLLTQELPKSENSSSDAVVALPPPPEHPPEPVSVLVPESLTSETPETPTSEHPPEPISVFVPESLTSETPETPTSEHPPEPISVLVPESFTSETSENPTPEHPTPEHPTPEHPTPEHPPKPVSVLVPDSSPAKLNPYSPQQIQQEVTPRQQKPPSSPNSSSVQIGFLLVLLSTVMSSLYNVVVKALFYQGSDLLGNFQTQQLMSPTLGNIFLILMLRLLVVVPLMLLLAPILHPPVWQDLQSLFDSVSRNAAAKKTNTKQVLLLSVVSGGFLFLSQVLIYIAIGQVTTGVAIALFFIYPMITVLLAWFLFRERPGLLSFSAISSIFCGQLLILGSYSTGINNTSLGIISGIMSGIAFSVYVILTRLSAPKLHPVSFALINFATMLLFSFVCLLVPLPSDWSLAIRSSNLLEVILSAFMLGVLTLCGYLFNNFGIRKLGGQRSAIIGAFVPVFTVIFAGLMIQEKLDILQILGVLLVTGGAVAISWEKMQKVKSSSAKN